MDIFDFPDDYKPEKPLSKEQMDEITDYLTNHPLFMKEVPENVQGNPHLAALQNIIYDQEPDVLAENLNKQGNERLQVNPHHPFYMKDAYKRYTEGIKVKCPNPQINAKLHSNRAMINLRLKNYGKVIQDCKSAIKFNPNYTKAYYRYAQALKGLQKHQQCVALLKDRTQKQLKQLYDEARKTLNDKNKTKEQKQNLTQQKANLLYKYCKQRGWKMKKRSEPIPGESKIQFIDNKIVFPMLVLYPQFGQVDVLQKITEQSNIRESLEQIISSIPWDVSGVYNAQNINLFVEVAPHTMLKLKPSLCVCQLLKVYEFPEAIEVNVVSSNSKYYPLFMKENKIVQ